MSKIAELTEGGLWTIKETLAERYGKPIEPTLADTELRLNPHDTELDVSPTADWEYEGCHFVICKTGNRRYRCQFFYRSHEMFGTGVEEFDDLSECAATLLQAQADHAASMVEA